MSTDTQRPLVNGNARRGMNGHMNGHINGHMNGNGHRTSSDADFQQLDKQLWAAPYLSTFHGDGLIGDKRRPSGAIANLRNRLDDFKRIFKFSNLPAIVEVIFRFLEGNGLDIKAGARLVAAMSNDSNLRAAFIESQVRIKYERMLHPPLTYLGDAFKYRTADGKFNSALHPQLGQAGAPYAKTVPSKTHPLGALPDPGDLFDRLMARDKRRDSFSGLSSMLVYHATIIIHDIFRTNDSDKNISDTSSYLDLSPLYGFTEEMQRQVRDDKYKLGLLKPDTFAEDRLLRQPPGVCIMLVMYNRYHNYAATQLRRINENGKFTIPSRFGPPALAAAAKHFVKNRSRDMEQLLDDYTSCWRDRFALEDDEAPNSKTAPPLNPDFSKWEKQLQEMLDAWVGEVPSESRQKKYQLEQFYKEHTAAWDKQDDDLFQTARLITCGLYIQISIHDYLRALMGFHQYNTNFTLDPRLDMKDHKNVSRGLGNQVTVEFNLLYRFHCAISANDEKYAEGFIQESFEKIGKPLPNPKDISMDNFMQLMSSLRQAGAGQPAVKPWEIEFGLKHQPELNFTRNSITGLFDDQQMINTLKKAMDDPISNFGPKNVPKCLKPVEVLGIIQARKWEIGTLNDFRDFFGMKRHDSFESITPNPEVQTALRDLYDHPDKVELYPGIFCESDRDMSADPGPSDVDSALWAAIFSDAITLVRSDRFYTVDWNTNSLTTWGMNEVTPDNNVVKSSVFHRLLQRAFPEWYPSTSINFFHPFYTSQKNAEFAEQQGFSQNFKFEKNPAYRKGKKKNDGIAVESPAKYITTGSEPTRPWKPVYLTQRSDIITVLMDKSDKLVHPARLNLVDLPAKVAEVLEPAGDSRTNDRGSQLEGFQLDDDSDAMKKYFTDLMRDIMKRERVTMVNSPQNPTYQIDVVRDFAIPVVTRYVADFLGFGHVIKSEHNPGAKYSENQIYQHITNCQVFLSYNVDETKVMKRRQAFKSSMSFLYKLTQEGNIREARWGWLRHVFSFSPKNPMKELGLKVAREILRSERDSCRAAAILLLIGLDSAYNTVVAFTSVLNELIEKLYDIAYDPEKTTCDLMTLQEEAIKIHGSNTYESQKSWANIRNIVLDVQKRCVQLPVVKKAIADYKIPGTKLEFKKGQTIICDILEAEKKEKSTSSNEGDYLAYASGFTDKFASYHPKHVAFLSLAIMIKELSLLKNLRRGHDTQGRPKRIKIEQTYEGYSNYMAPMRMLEIELKVKRELERQRRSGGTPSKDLSEVFTKEVMKPTTNTFLTTEWDEMIPFPTTWKVRFDGYGPSDYGPQCSKLKSARLADNIPPFYQPVGLSRVGGSFATPVCVCGKPDSTCGCKQGPKSLPDGGVPTEAKAITAGCGMP